SYINITATYYFAIIRGIRDFKFLAQRNFVSSLIKIVIASILAYTPLGIIGVWLSYLVYNIVQKYMSKIQLQKKENIAYQNNKNSLREVQRYVNQTNEIRGFNNQEITKTMLLLTEEVGELAKAIRKNATDIKTDMEKQSNYDTIESEVADVFYVLSCVCNKL